MNLNTDKHIPRKRFGQNFLHDRSIIDKIVRAVGPKPGQTLVEIGPGQGAITLPLLEKQPSLHVIELDRDLVSSLELLRATHPGLTIHQADALNFDFSSLVDPELKERKEINERKEETERKELNESNSSNSHTPLRILGNLPYNISTPLLFHLLEFKHLITDMHFMLQKEVVDRLASPPGKKTYGRLSVMMQYFCQVEPLFTVAPGCFYPPPKVDSAIVRLVPHAEIKTPAENLDVFRELVNRCFQKRRKTMRNCLRQWLPHLNIDALNLEACNIEISARPDTITLDQYVALSNQLLPYISKEGI